MLDGFAIIIIRVINGRALHAGPPGTGDSARALCYGQGLAAPDQRGHGPNLAGPLPCPRVARLPLSRGCFALYAVSWQSLRDGPSSRQIGLQHFLPCRSAVSGGACARQCRARTFALSLEPSNGSVAIAERLFSPRTRFAASIPNWRARKPRLVSFAPLSSKALGSPHHRSKANPER